MKIINIDKFGDEYGSLLGPYLTELCKMKILSHKMKKQQYSVFQKWLCTNIYVAGGKTGYLLFQKLFKLPGLSTIRRFLLKLKSGPGVNKMNARMLYVKVAAKNEHEKMCWLLLDEMSLRPGLYFNSRTDSITGFSDDGLVRSKDLATSSLVIKVVGLTRAWKFPLGYNFSSGAISGEKLKHIVIRSIKILEAEGFNVVGLTTDQGSNFESMFGQCLKVTEDKPYFLLNDKKYIVCRDPPHLIKNARNFLLKGEVRMPGFEETAKWKHITELQEMNEACSLNMVPKLNLRTVSPKQLLFGARMKVKFAVNVLSHTVAATLNTLAQQKKMKKDVLATSAYCHKMNDLFDVLNSSSSKDIVPLRKPLKDNSPGIMVLTDSLDWLKNLQEANTGRPQVKFLKGFRQTINGVLELRKIFSEKKLVYLHTRRICQDPLELFFGKIRGGVSHPTPATFEEQYSRKSAASLIMAPITANCEPLESVPSEHLMETCSLFNKVSFISWLCNTVSCYIKSCLIV